jgi:hypothetical protein
LSAEATMKPGLCQVRSKTEHPCPRRAVVEILGIPFCGACARQQKAYFAIGELTQEERQGLRSSKPLAEALEGMLRERTGGIVAQRHQEFPGMDELGRLTLTKSCLPKAN